MLEVKYQLSVPGHGGIFIDMIRQFNNSNNSLYISLIQNLFDFNKTTIYLNLSTITLFSAIIKYNEQNPIDNILFNRVLLKCKELLAYYLKISDYDSSVK